MDLSTVLLQHESDRRLVCRVLVRVKQRCQRDAQGDSSGLVITVRKQSLQALVAQENGAICQHVCSGIAHLRTPGESIGHNIRGRALNHTSVVYCSMLEGAFTNRRLGNAVDSFLTWRLRSWSSRSRMEKPHQQSFLLNFFNLLRDEDKRTSFLPTSLLRSLYRFFFWLLSQT